MCVLTVCVGAYCMMQRMNRFSVDHSSLHINTHSSFECICVCVCESSFQSGSVLFELQHWAVNKSGLILVEAVDGVNHSG